MDLSLPSPTTRADLPISLLQLLSNTLVLYQTTPYLPVSALLALGATSKSYRELIHNTPNVFRHLDLTRVKAAQFNIAAIDHGGEVWRNVQMDENVTEDDFYGGPLLGIFNSLKRQRILQDVQTLVLDGLSVTSDLVADIILQDSFNIRTLSIREVQNLNERKLQQALLYAVRPSRAPNTPKLQALYIFGPKDTIPPPRPSRHGDHHPSSMGPIDARAFHGGVTASQGAQIGARWNQKSEDTLINELVNSGDKWYQSGGKVISKPPSMEWANTVLACQGIISFDAVLCEGPRHEFYPQPRDSEPYPWYHHPNAHLSSRIATHSVGGCAGCGTAPESFSTFGVTSNDRFPLLAPVPLHCSTAKAAKAPFAASGNKLLVRCMDCVRNRCCENCHKWWCEDCYEVPSHAYISGSTPPWEITRTAVGGQTEKHVKVHMGLCVEDCLVAEMMSGAGSNGMWG
jgi:hypothetical protein